jgi:hypothetical protein
MSRKNKFSLATAWTKKDISSSEKRKQFTVVIANTALEIFLQQRIKSLEHAQKNGQLSL